MDQAATPRRGGRSERSALWGATLIWAAASIVLMLVAAFGPFREGREEYWRLGPHISESGVENGGGWVTLTAAGVAAIVLAFYAAFHNRRGSSAFLIAAIVAGALFTLLMLLVRLLIPIGCEGAASPATGCREGEEYLVAVGWGFNVYLLAWISLTIAWVALLVQRRR